MSSTTSVYGLPASVRLTTSDGGATLRIDYMPTNLIVLFPPGATSATATFKIIGDTLIETNETFVVRLAAVTNAVAARAQGVCTILDDDFKVTVQATTGGDARLNFTTQTNRTYRVERTDDLTPPVTWSAVPGAETVPGTGASVQVLDPGAMIQPKRFYRVRQLP